MIQGTKVMVQMENVTVKGIIRWKTSFVINELHCLDEKLHGSMDELHSSDEKLHGSRDELHGSDKNFMVQGMNSMVQMKNFLV